MKDKISMLKELLPLTQALKILYVEDNEEARIQTLKMLTNFCKNIDIAVNGQEGLEKYKDFFNTNNTYYDLIITDINMPIMDGLEMSRSILDIYNKQHIIVISAYNDSQNLQMCMDAGITNYLHKPVKLESIIEIMGKVVKSIQVDQSSKKHLTEIEKLNFELDALVTSFDTYVIASRTDLNGNITYVSKAYETISGYTKEELLGQPHAIVKHPDNKRALFEELWQTIQSGKLWNGEIKNFNKDGSYYWEYNSIAPYYDAYGTHIGYSAIRVDITSQKKVEELNKQVSDLLNNAGQGFLSFDENLMCESGFSKECLNIFGMDNIEEVDISELLFGDNPSKKNLFKKAIKNVLDSDNTTTQELFLSLLPQEHTIDKKTISIKYKLLQNNRFMVILTDITDKKILEKQLNSQHQLQKMIMSVAANRDDFLEIKSEFEDFISNPPKQKLELLRSLHTFKGIFAQKEMLYIVDEIHLFESNIKEDHEPSIDAFYKLTQTFNKDLDAIKLNLQKDFLVKNNQLRINDNSLIVIEDKIRSLLINDDKLKDDLDEILFHINKLRYKSVKDMLGIYPKHVNTMAQKLVKYIYPLEIEGDPDVVVSSKITPFIKSLVHLFNNSVDHGIENIDTRAEIGKDEIATIKCSFEQIKNILILEISDNGNGIDVDRLINSVIKKGFKTKKECALLTEDEKLELVFLDNLSTHEKATLISGRGIGMSAIRKVVDDLNGKILINNSPGIGVTFKFLIPIEDRISTKYYYQDEDIILDSLSEQVNILLRDNCNIQILEEKIIDEIDSTCLTQYSSKIDLISGYDGSLIICYAPQMNTGIKDAFIPSGFSDEETDEMLAELPAEIINTVAGLAISGFPKHLGAVAISVPMPITKSYHEQIINNKNNRLIKEITTTYGKFFCIVIKNESSNVELKNNETVKEIALV